MLFTMAIAIGGAVWGGHELDQYQGNKKPVWTIVCSLLGIAIALYLVIRDAKKLSDKN